MENYEQKYKEVLAIVKQLADNNPHDEGIQAWVQDNFPELRESEDERIRKELIAHFKTNSVSESWSGLNVNKVLAWLEKQGERKRETIILKFKTGDKVTNGLDTYTIDAIGKDCYWIKEHDCASILFESQHYWKIVEQKPAWNENDETAVARIIETIESAKIIRDGTYIDEILNELNSWIKSLKDRLLPQPKQEWSVDDERAYRSVLYDFEHHFPLNCVQQEFVKSHIQPQNRWKPSDEQMADLWNMVCECRPADQQLLQDIYYGLKTLRGE